MSLPLLSTLSATCDCLNRCFEVCYRVLMDDPAIYIVIVGGPSFVEVYPVPVRIDRAIRNRRIKLLGNILPYAVTHIPCAVCSLKGYLFFPSFRTVSPFTESCFTYAASSLVALSLASFMSASLFSALRIWLLLVTILFCHLANSEPPLTVPLCWSRSQSSCP